MTYAFGLELTDPGFDFSVLSEYWTRLVQAAAEHLLLDALLGACKERGSFKARDRQRSDATHLLGVVRLLNRLAKAAETLRAASHCVQGCAPEWLQERTTPEWFERYGRRIIEEYRLAGGKEARRNYAALVGADGMHFLAELYTRMAPADLHHLPAVDVLPRTWIQQYLVIDGHIRLRLPKEMPAASEQLESPSTRTCVMPARMSGTEWAQGASDRKV